MRDRCADRVAPSELPFAAEIFDLAPKHEDWRVAADVVLRGFATQLVIGSATYDRVRDTLNPRRFARRFAGFTGLRAGEIVALRTESVDLLHGRVQVVASATEAYGKLQFGPTKTYTDVRCRSLKRWSRN